MKNYRAILQEFGTRLLIARLKTPISSMVPVKFLLALVMEWVDTEERYGEAVSHIFNYSQPCLTAKI